ncbi:unnamed protein product [Anisakis simplex]|uniref:Thyroid adenoma-associated protein (inferred by orthology to a human protein) n=1 Tax=Anisakis simplex TaxID=6269 RepID=A0A0M3K4S6_ANISI|nr:unnamed protein product [Anisakis simplex]
MASAMDLNSSSRNPKRGGSKHAVHSTIAFSAMRVFQHCKQGNNSTNENNSVDTSNASVVLVNTVDKRSDNSGLVISAISGERPCAWILSIAEWLLVDSAKWPRSHFRCLLVFMEQYPTVICQLPDKFICTLYARIGNPTLTLAISDLIVYDLLKCLSKDSKRCELHSKLLTEVLCSSSEQVRMASRERLIPIMFKDSQLTKWIITRFAVHLAEDISDDRRLDAVLSLSKYCISHQKSFSNASEYCKWSDFIDEKRFAQALLHSQSFIRLSAWSLISEHPKLTLQIQEREVDFIKAFLLTNMAEQCPSTRQKILAGLRKVFIRLREISQSLMKQQQQQRKTSNEHDTTDSLSHHPLLKCYTNFLIWLKDFCIECLDCGANFSRRIMALHILDYIFKQPFLRDQNKDLFFNSIKRQLCLSKEDHAKLLSILDDSYQLCQTLAIDLLVSDDCCSDQNFTDMSEFLAETKHVMLSSVRSNNSESASYRIRYFIFKSTRSDVDALFKYLIALCVQRIQLIGDNLLMLTNQNGSLHPILNAIATIVECMQWDKLSADESREWRHNIAELLLPLCARVGDLVSPVVRSMSPEGYLPENFITDKDMSCVSDLVSLAETSQLLLVGCWRAHKHISTLLHSIAEKVPYPEMISSEVVGRIGDYYWLHLTECKHCGAFELAVQGFEALCKRLWKIQERRRDCSNDKDKDLPNPEKWLDDIIVAIKGGDDKTKLCSTRRSAGLPFMVCAILGTEPKSRDSKCLRKALSKLLEFDDLTPELQLSDLAKTFALSLLWFAPGYGDKRLSESVLFGLEEALFVSLSGIASVYWPVRNAISQLFSTLLIRIFGVSRSAQRTLKVPEKNRMSAYEFFSRFPSLYDLLYSQLCAFRDVNSEFRVFPVLMLLTHLFPSTQTNAQYPLSVFILPIIRVLLRAKTEKLRQLAAYSIAVICEYQVRILLAANPFPPTIVWEQFSGCNPFDRVDPKHVFEETATSKSSEFVTFNDSDLSSDDRKSIVEILSKNRSLRFQLWRALTKANVHGGVNATSISMELLRMAAADLLCFETHKNGILLVLIENSARIVEDNECLSKLNCFIAQNAASLRMDLSEYLARLLAMKVKLSDSTDLRWILECARRESLELKCIALQGFRIACDRAEVFSSREVLKIGAMLLQDEETAVREESASILCEFIAENVRRHQNDTNDETTGAPKTPSPIVHLNAQIVSWILHDKIPNLHDAICEHFAISADSTNDTNRLFDACAVNPFVEPHPIGKEHFEVLERIGLVNNCLELRF